MPASQTAIAKQGTAHFHAYWEDMADGSCRCFDSSNLAKEQLLPISIAQDYFTKWADATSLADQSACTITVALIKLFSVLGCPFQIKVVILKAPCSNNC